MGRAVPEDEVAMQRQQRGIRCKHRTIAVEVLEQDWLLDRATVLKA
jgi:hypothetical protein